MKIGLQIILGVASLIPAYYGALNMFYGAARFMAPEHVTAAIDSQFRFQSAYYFGLAFIIWFIIPNIERRTTLFRIVAIAIFLGGLARVYSYLTIGAPSSSMVAAMVFELSMPLLILWQAKIAER